MSEARVFLTEIVKHCDACLSEKERPKAPHSPGPAAVTPPLHEEVSQ